MTTVVACAVDGVVYMGSDSMTNVYERPIIDGARKVARVAVTDQPDQALLGVSGDKGVLDLIRHRIEALPGLPEDPQDLDGWAYSVARSLAELSTEGGVVDNGRMDGNVLLGYRGLLWSLAHGSYVRHLDGRAALGSGEGPGIGALDALLEAGCDPSTAVVKALAVAAERDKHTAAPFYLEVLDAAA